MINAAGMMYREEQAAIRARLVLPVCGAILVGGLAGLPLALGWHSVALALVAAVIGGLVLLRWPVAGFYGLAGATLLFDSYSIEALNVPSAVVPYWTSVNGFTPLPLPVTPAELALLATVGVIVLRRLHDSRRPVLHGGRLLVPLLIFLGAVAYGVLRGIALQDRLLATPFSLQIAVIEARAFISLALMYLLTVTVVDSPARLRPLLWVIVVVLALKALQAIWLTAQLGSAIFEMNEIAPHEESLFWSGLFLLAVGLWACTRASRLRFTVTALLPVIAFALIANQRRISFVALGVGLLLSWLLLLTLPHLRHRMLTGGVVLAVVLGTYMALAACLSNRGGALGGRARIGARCSIERLAGDGERQHRAHDRASAGGGDRFRAPHRLLGGATAHG
jgi:hypothetical protein